MDFKVNNILCAVDFSKFSQPVLDYATGLAQGFDTDITVFHALNIPRTSLPDDAICAPGTDEAEQAVLDNHIPQTAAIKRGAGDFEIEYDDHVLDGV